MIKLSSYETHLLINQSGSMEPVDLKKTKPDDVVSLLTALQRTPSIAQWRNAAFTAAVDKFLKTKGDTETVMQTGEAFGRGLFTEYLKDPPKEWTMKKWLESTDQVLTPLGTPLECLKLNSDNAESIITRLTFPDLEQQEVGSLFTYGYLRGLFISAFPNGELLMEDPSHAPVSAFIFKTHASIKDRFERERVKQLFTSMKKV